MSSFIKRFITALCLLGSCAVWAQSAGTPQGGDCKLASGDENLLAIMDGARQINIGYRVAEMETDVSAGSTLANVFSLGIVSEKGKYSAVISGSTSSNRI